MHDGDGTGDARDGGPDWPTVVAVASVSIDGALVLALTFLVFS